MRRRGRAGVPVEPDVRCAVAQRDGNSGRRVDQRAPGVRRGRDSDPLAASDAGRGQGGARAGSSSARTGGRSSILHTARGCWRAHRRCRTESTTHGSRSKRRPRRATIPTAWARWTTTGSWKSTLAHSMRGRDHESSGVEGTHVFGDHHGDLRVGGAYGRPVDLPQAERDHPLLRWRRGKRAG